MMNETYCGYVALVGRPNVGKSTLLNHLIGDKVSITSRKPQTTRYQILGIKTLAQQQIIYVDTPGMHKKTPRPSNKHLNATAVGALANVDVIIFVVEALKWLADDAMVLQKIMPYPGPKILVINKVDTITDKTLLLPKIQKWGASGNFVAIIPVAAKYGKGLDLIETEVLKLLPPKPFYYDSSLLTDTSERFFTAEIIREKIIRLVGEELPYETSVVIDSYTMQPKILHIAATIFVAKEGQKAIIIGKKGALLKNIGSLARSDLERHLAQQVCLKLWVKVKNNWSSYEQCVDSF